MMADAGRGAGGDDEPEVAPLFAEGRFRGYMRVELGPRRLTADLRGMDSVQWRDAACRTLASFVVEDGARTPQRAL